MNESSTSMVAMPVGHVWGAGCDQECVRLGRCYYRGVSWLWPQGTVGLASIALVAATVVSMVQGEDAAAILMTAIPAAICVFVWRLGVRFDARH